MTDKFSREIVDLADGGVSFFAITPNDNVDLAYTTRGLHANGTGTVYVDGKDLGTNIELYVVAGMTYPYRVNRVRSTGTTATVVGMF